MHRNRHSALVVSAAVPVVLAACLAEPAGPRGAIPFLQPPAVYAGWWGDMETCSSVAAPLTRVDWYEVPGDQFATPQGWRWGWWQPPHSIYLAQAHVLDERLVEHEMLHDLLQVGTHPPQFQTCGVTYPNDARIE